MPPCTTLTPALHTPHNGACLPACLGAWVPACSSLLQTQFAGTPCAWCYLSAGLSFSMALTLIFGMPARQLQAAAMPGAGVMLATVALLYGGLYVANPGQVDADEDFQLEYRVSCGTSDHSTACMPAAQRLSSACAVRHMGVGGPCHAYRR